MFNAMSDRISGDLDRIGSKGLTRLQEAVDDGDDDRVRLLIKRKASLNETGLCGESPLHRAVTQGHFTVARILIDAGADVNLPDANGMTPLHRAVMAGNTMLATRLIDAGADVGMVDVEGRSVMHLVPPHAYEFFALLRNAGADPNALDKNGHPPLNYHLRHERLVLALTQAGGDPNLSTTQVSPLSLALSLAPIGNQPKIILHLIAAGGNVNTCADTGESLLHLAARGGQGVITLEALRRGADVTVPDRQGMTVAHALAQLPQPEMLRTVLQRAPQLAHTADANGITPMRLVLRHLAQTPARGAETHVATLMQMARILIENGADPSTQGDNGATLLHEAVARNLPDMIIYLSANKADFDRKDAQGFAPLHLAVNMRSIDLVDALLDHNADPDLTDARGWTLLDRLAERKDRDSPIVQRLIVAGGQYSKQLPLYPDLMRPRGGQPPQHRLPANDTAAKPVRQLEDRDTPEAEHPPVISPVKKIIKRQNPPQN